MPYGEDVTVIADGDVVLRRKIVAVENGVYFVTRPEEYQAAQREGREPVCIGFREVFVLRKDATLPK